MSVSFLYQFANYSFSVVSINQFIVQFPLSADPKLYMVAERGSFV